MTKTKIFFIYLMLLISASIFAQSPRNIAYQEDCVRFTVITDGVIRLEWQPEGRFTDRPILAAENASNVGHFLRCQVRQHCGRNLLPHDMALLKLAIDPTQQSR